MSIKGDLAFAQVMAHCGGSPAAGVSYVVRAVVNDPGNPEPYAALDELRRELAAEIEPAVATADTPSLMIARAYFAFKDGDMDEAAMSLGSVTGFRPEVSWASAPWFNDKQFLDLVTPEALAEATMRIRDYGHDLATEEIRASLSPWFRAIDVVCARDPDADAMARLAMVLRSCGRTQSAFDLLDKADAVERIMFTEVVRGGTWREAGDLAEAEAAFRRALAMDSENWSLCLDLADLAALRGDFAEAAAFAERGAKLEPGEAIVRAAAAVYRGRQSGIPAGPAAVGDVDGPYRQTLLDYMNGG